MSDTDEPIHVEHIHPAPEGTPMKIIDASLPTVLAHRLAFWSKDAAGLLTLTFAEERPQLNDPGVPALHVCARIVLPVSALEGMLHFLESAKSPHVFTGTAPSSSAVN